MGGVVAHRQYRIPELPTLDAVRRTVPLQLATNPQRQGDASLTRQLDWSFPDLDFAIFGLTFVPISAACETNADDNVILGNPDRRLGLS